MSYKELQNALKSYKAQGLTQVKLNSKQEVLQAEYDRLTTVEEEVINTEVVATQADAGYCELTCEVPVPVATQQSQRPIANLINDQVGGSFYQRPVLKGKVNAQTVSEVKRQASQAPRHQTPVKDKYINKPQVNEVRQQAIKGSDKKASCKFNTTHNEYFVNDQHSRYTRTLGTTEKQALDNVKSFVNIVKQVAIGFSQRQAQRNGIAA